MNKEYYKNTFSKVCPSDETIERIFNITEEKSKKLKHKGLIIVLAVIFTLICGTFTVNAVTDGELFNGIKVFINGNEVNAEDYIKNYRTYKDEETGENVVSYNIEIPDENNENGPTIAQYYSRRDNNENKHYGCGIGYGRIDNSGFKTYKMIEIRE